MSVEAPHDEVERIWPTTSNQAEYRLKFPDHFARYDYASQLVSGRAVLDCACGTGYGSWLLSQAGARSVVGVDVDQEAIQWASAHFKLPNNDFRLRSEQSLPLANEEVDQVISLETIEHLENPGLFVSELARVLVPGGRLLLSTPLTTGPERLKPDNIYHLREFNAAELEELLRPHFTIRERLGQHSQTAARFAQLKRSPLVGSLVRAGVHRALPQRARSLARRLLRGSSGRDPVWISGERWEDAPVQIVLAVKK